MRIRTSIRNFTIQYTKKELDQIQSEFVKQINTYIARVNNRIIKTLEEIEKEAAEVVEVFPLTITIIEREKKQKEEVL